MERPQLTGRASSVDRDFKLEPSPPPVSLQEVDLSQELAKLTRRRDSLTKSLNDEEDQWQIELLKRESNSHRHQQEDLLREREDMLREREDIRRREEDRRRKEEDRQRLEEESSEKSETRRRQLRLFEIRSERAQNRKKAEDVWKSAQSGWERGSITVALMTSSEGGQALEKSTQNERTVGSSVTSGFPSLPTWTPPVNGTKVPKKRLRVITEPSPEDSDSSPKLKRISKPSEKVRDSVPLRSTLEQNTGHSRPVLSGDISEQPGTFVFEYVDSSGRGIWLDQKTNIKMYLQCPHCLKSDFKTIKFFKRHWSETHEYKGITDEDNVTIFRKWGIQIGEQRQAEHDSRQRRNHLTENSRSTVTPNNYVEGNLSSSDDEVEEGMGDIHYEPAFSARSGKSTSGSTPSQSFRKLSEIMHSQSRAQSEQCTPSPLNSGPQAHSQLLSSQNPSSHRTNTISAQTRALGKPSGLHSSTHNSTPTPADLRERTEKQSQQVSNGKGKHNNQRRMASVAATADGNDDDVDDERYVDDESDTSDNDSIMVRTS